jgi:hypothetical protein
MDLGFGPDRKSPELARLLSIIPGLGHFYIDQFAVGLIWFIIAILELYITIWSFFDSFWSVYTYGRLRFSLMLIVLYFGLILWSGDNASRKAAEYNARKAMDEEFSAENRTKKKFSELVKKDTKRANRI